jgi:acid phosphatase family membrane protein YuiD
VSEALTLGIGFLKGFATSSLFLLALFIGFCVIVGFTKLKRTAGGTARVIKSLDERVSKQPMVYLPPTAPRGPGDPLEGFGTRRAGGT